ncbi:MAG: WD40 repeat domain-containing protein [Cyanobacteria bacterium P01_H01_bin.15]
MRSRLASLSLLLATALMLVNCQLPGSDTSDSASISPPTTAEKPDAASPWQTVKLVRTMAAHRSTVRSLAISPDSQTLATGSLGRRLKVWALASGEELREIPMQQSVESLVFSPNSQTFASGEYGGMLKIWDRAGEGNEPQIAVDAHEFAIYGLVFSPDGSTVISGSIDETIKVWDSLTGEQVGNTIQTDDSVLRLVIGSVGDVIGYSLFNGEVRFRYLQSGDLIRGFASGAYPQFALTVSPDDKYLVAGGASNIIVIWDIESGRIIRAMTQHTDAIRDLAISPDGTTLASTGSDKTVKIWSFPEGKLLNSLDTMRSFAIAFSPDGKYLVSAGDEGKVMIWQPGSEPDDETED